LSFTFTELVVYKHVFIGSHYRNYYKCSHCGRNRLKEQTVMDMCFLSFTFTELRLQTCVYRMVLSELCLQTFFDRASLIELCSQSFVYTAVFTELCLQIFLDGALFTEICHVIGTRINKDHT